MRLGKGWQRQDPHPDPAVDVQHLPDAAAALPRLGTPCSPRALPNPKCRAGCSQQSPTKPCANQEHMEELSPRSPWLSFGLAAEFGTSRSLKGVWELCFLLQLGKKNTNKQQPFNYYFIKNVILKVVFIPTAEP